MRYFRILSSFAGEPLALERSKLIAVASFLKFKATGGDLSAEEIEARIGKRQENAVYKGAGTVAVLPVYGILAQRMNLMDEMSGGTSTDQLLRQFRALIADDGTKAIILDMDSPGGTVPGTEELAAEIFAARGTKPVVAQINSLAASAAYWIASNAEEIVVTPSGRAGSIGVYALHEDISALLDGEGIKETLIFAGKYKVEGNPFEPLAEEARQEIQRRVDETYSAFVESVARGRGVEARVVEDKFGQGRVFGAGELVKRGMADRVGTLADTLERFGIAPRPAALRPKEGQREAAVIMLRDKLKARQEPTRGELAQGLRVALGLTNSEAEEAVYDLLHARSGEPEAVTEQAATKEDIAALRGDLAGILSHLTQ